MVQMIRRAGGEDRLRAAADPDTAAMCHRRASAALVHPLPHTHTSKYRTICAAPFQGPTIDRRRNQRIRWTSSELSGSWSRTRGHGMETNAGLSLYYLILLSLAPSSLFLRLPASPACLLSPFRRPFYLGREDESPFHERKRTRSTDTVVIRVAFTLQQRMRRLTTG